MTLHRRSAFYFSLALLVSILGFFPSYFSVFLKTDAVHHFHGLTATAWMLLLIAQAWLIRSRNLSLHRTLGWASLVLAGLFLASGILMVDAMLKGRGAFSRAFGSRLALVDLLSLLYFAVAYALAIRHRKDIHLHARFMASTAVLVLPPALARLLPMAFSGIPSFEVAFHGSYFISEGIALLLILDDRRQGRFRVPYPLLMGVLLVQQVGFAVAPGIPRWKAFTDGVISRP